MWAQPIGGSEVGCEGVMHLLARTRAAMAGLMAEVVEEHVRMHLVDTEASSGHPGLVG